VSVSVAGSACQNRVPQSAAAAAQPQRRTASGAVLWRWVAQRLTASASTQGMADRSSAGQRRWPPGTAAPAVASSSSPWSPSPAPAASASPSRGDNGKRTRLANTPGTATAASGIAAKLSRMPTTATAPSAAAVRGAVASVAPSDELRVRHQNDGPSARSLQRVKVEAPHRAATESQPPRSIIERGSTRSTQRQVADRSEFASTLRCRARLTARSTASAAALVAGAGQPRNPT
jgi:hypothetical protein